MKKKIFGLLVCSYIISSILSVIALAVVCVQKGFFEGLAALVVAAGWTLFLIGPIALALSATRDLVDILRNPRRRIAGIAIVETNAEEGTVTIEEEDK